MDEYDDSSILILYIIIFLLLAVIVIILYGFIINLNNLTILDNEFLDSVCTEIYGEGYIYYDDENFNIDEEISCYKPLEENQTKQFIKKLNLCNTCELRK